MCFKATYTESEKRNQVAKVLNLLNSPINTEAEKKNLLYNLAFMNNMVVKGYMQVRTEMDNVIYSVKDHAIREIARIMPERCMCSSGVFYAYASDRQYSFHYRGNAPCVYRNVLWDEIENGWSLSDDEYRCRVTRVKTQKAYEEQELETLNKKRIRDIKLEVVHAVNVARNGRATVTRFWQAAEKNLTKRQKRSKAFQEHDLRRCWKLWAYKLGFMQAVPTTYVSFYRCSIEGQRIAKDFFNKMVSLHIIRDFSKII